MRNQKSISSDLIVLFYRMIVTFRSIYRRFRKNSDNSHGNVKGVSGSLTPDSLYKVLTVADVNETNVVDIGAGDGKPLAAAMAYGASSAHGFELPENQANAFIFKAAMSMIVNSMFLNPSVLSRVRLEFKDIETVCSNSSFTSELH